MLANKLDAASRSDAIDAESTKRRRIEYKMAASINLQTDSEPFILDIKARPVLWRSSDPDRTNKAKIKKSWEEVKKKYPGFSVEELKRRWKNLRDAYRKEIKRLPQSKTGAIPENVRSHWRYYDSLSFLKEEVFLNNTSSNKEPEPTVEPVVVAEKELPCPRESASPEPVSSDSDEEMEKRKDPKEIREELLNIEKRKMKILEQEIARSNEHTKSDNYHFLMSLLPEMDRLPPLQKMRLRTKISQAVLDEVSMCTYETPQTYTDIQQINFRDAQITKSDIIDIKEEPINMYE